jgi:hypothetical protein
MSGKISARLPLDAMLGEAGRWRAAAENMFTAGATARSLSLSAADFSGAADEAGLVESYTNLHATLHKLIWQGGEQFMDTADRLEKVVRRSEQTERESAERLVRVERFLDEQGL